jgi:RecA-family ATPase
METAKGSSAMRASMNGSGAGVNYDAACLSLDRVALLLDGEVSGGQILAPGPEHSRDDRSLSVKLDPQAPDGFVVNSFSGDDPIKCRDYVRERLSMPSWQPRNRESPFQIRDLGAPSAVWQYSDAKGKLAGAVARYDGAAGKEIRPWRRHDDRWRIGGMLEPRPLYRLMQLIASQGPVLFVEGEKTAEAAARLFPDCAVTTSAGGAQAARKTDWSPLRRRDVVVWPDNDDPGRRHAAAVAELVGEAGAASVRVVDIPMNWPKGWDLADAPPAEVTREQIRALLRSAAEVATAPDLERVAREILALDIVSALELLRSPAPRRQWLAEPWIPHRDVTMLAGDGGIGKSTIALQLGTATAIGALWFGLEVLKGPVLYVSCEDDLPEIHFRLQQIRTQEPDVELSGLHIISLAGLPTLLAIPDTKGELKPTPLWDRLEEALEQTGARLLILDAAADLYGGNENDRGQVRTFVQMLRGLAIRRDCAVLLLAHPSVDGMKTGRGYAGSTAWNNSVRSRLYFAAATIDEDGGPNSDLRVLKLAKANRSKAGQQKRLRWHDGCFVLEGAHQDGLNRLDRELEAEQIFLALLDSYNAQNRHVSDASGANFAPKVFTDAPEAKGTSGAQFKAAMNRLFTAGKIRVQIVGPQSRQRRHIARVPP